MEANPTSQVLSHNTAENKTCPAGSITAHSPQQTWCETSRQKPSRLTPAHCTSCVQALLRFPSCYYYYFKNRPTSRLAALSEESPYCEVYVQDAPPIRTGRALIGRGDVTQRRHPWLVQRHSGSNWGELKEGRGFAQDWIKRVAFTLHIYQHILMYWTSLLPWRFIRLPSPRLDLHDLYFQA